jgi:OOP family OmpA-OmpF porin
MHSRGDLNECCRWFRLYYGVESSALSVHGYGDTKPLATNANEDGRSKNRRVEIRVTKQG